MKFWVNRRQIRVSILFIQIIIWYFVVIQTITPTFQAYIIAPIKTAFNDCFDILHNDKTEFLARRWKIDHGYNGFTRNSRGMTMIAKAKSRKKNDDLDYNNEENIEDVHINYDDLMERWIAMGNSKKSFSVSKALSAMYMGRNGLTAIDDDDDDIGQPMNAKTMKEIISMMNKKKQGVLQKNEDKSRPDTERPVDDNKTSQSDRKTLRKLLLSRTKVSERKSIEDLNTSVAIKEKNKAVTNESRKITKAVSLAKEVAPKAQNCVKEPVTRKRSVGIDLGTTNSAISIIENGMPMIIPVDGQRIVPSVVTYKTIDGSTTNITIGATAKYQLLINPKNTFSSVKRLIGKQGKNDRDNRNDRSVDLLSSMKKSKSNINQNNQSNNQTIISSERLSCPALGRDLSPEEVSAEVLKKLLNAAKEFTGHEISNAVVTVPAYFSKEQCQATEIAGKLAGLEKVKLLREPEAAALAYGLTRKKPQIVLVFDLGGGTFDVSILEVGGGFVEVIATSGDSHLGGDDFDAAIATWLIEQIANKKASQSKSDTSDCSILSPSTLISQIKRDPLLLSKIYIAAENAKIDLSVNKSVTIELGNMFNDGNLYSFNMTQGKFESLTKSLLQRLLRPLREAAITAGINLPGDSGQIGIDESIGDDDESMESDGEDSMMAAMKKVQLEGRKLARSRQKAKGKSISELKRLQKETGSPQLTIFPSGQILDEVILVGGGTRVPAVRRLVRVMTGVNPKATVNVDEAVSLGAAIMAGILDGDIQDMQVLSAFQAAMYRAFSGISKSES